MTETKGNQVITKEVNYSIKTSLHPIYKNYRVLTQNGSLRARSRRPRRRVPPQLRGRGRCRTMRACRELLACGAP